MSEEIVNLKKFDKKIIQIISGIGSIEFFVSYILDLLDADTLASTIFFFSAAILAIVGYRVFSSNQRNPIPADLIYRDRQFRLLLGFILVWGVGLILQFWFLYSPILLFSSEEFLFGIGILVGSALMIDYPLKILYQKIGRKHGIPANLLISDRSRIGIMIQSFLLWIAFAFILTNIYPLGSDVGFVLGLIIPCTVFVTSALLMWINPPSSIDNIEAFRYWYEKTHPISTRLVGIAMIIPIFIVLFLRPFGEIIMALALLLFLLFVFYIPEELLKRKLRKLIEDSDSRDIYSTENEEFGRI